MTLVVNNNKRRGRGALTKNSKKCFNRLKDYMNMSHLLYLFIRNPFSPGKILDGS